MHRGLTKAVAVSLFASFSFGSTVGQAFADTGVTSLTLTPAGWPFVVDQTTTTNPVTSGVVHQAIHFDTAGGALKANVLSVDLSNSNVQVGAVLANNQVYSSDETVSSMANRTGAVGGINGDFFELGASGRPENLVVSNGAVLQSPLPGGYAVVGITADKHVTIGSETLGGTVTVTTATGTTSTGSASSGQTVTSTVYGPQTNSFSLIAINRPSTENGGKLGIMTPSMGSLVYVKSDTVAYLVPISNAPTNTGYSVVRVQSGVNVIPKLTGQIALVAGGGAAAQWMTNHVTPGSTVTINTALTPDPSIVQAVGVGYHLISNGQWYDDPHALATSLIYQKNPLTAVGVTRDGQHMFMVVFDGREVGGSAGLTYHQMASYLQSLGAWNAAMLDGGGSTEMVARRPGDTNVSVVNSPSDGAERRVADGLFVYSTETQPGPINQIVVGQGQPVAMLTGTTQSIRAYALDTNGNPVPGSLHLSVQPSTLARIQGGQLTSLTAGTGQIIATSTGGVTGSVPLTVVDQPATLSPTPSNALLAPGEQVTFNINAFTADGQPLAIQPSQVNWTANPASLGTVTANGAFRAAKAASDGTFRTATGTVTASMGTTSCTIPVTVGYDTSMINTMTKPTTWTTSAQSAGKLSLDKTVRAVSGDGGSMKISYAYSAGPGVEQAVFWPRATTTFGVNAAGEAPEALGFWLRGDQSQLQFALCLSDASGTRQTVYPLTVNFSGWRFITIPLPSHFVAPITVNYFDFLAAHPSKALKGALYMSDLQALYAPASKVSPASLTADAPSWIREVSSPTKFQGPGATVALVAGTNIASSAHTSAGMQLLQKMVQDAKARFKTPSKLKQSFAIQTLGDMVGTATEANMSTLRSTLTSSGLTVHVAVGAGELNGSANGAAFEQTFKATHYTYTVGQAQFVVLDDANGGITAADSRQSPRELQYPWLVKTLAASRAKVVVVTVNQPAYGRTPGSQQSITAVSDASLLEHLLVDYQQSHPTLHVILLTQAGSSTAIRSINPSGQDTAAGVTNVFIPLVASAVTSHVNPAYVLLHVDNQGVVQWTELHQTTTVPKTPTPTPTSSGGGAGAIHARA